MKKDRYAWVTILPACWLLICTLTAGWQKIFSADPKVGFLAHANRYADSMAQSKVLAPAKSMEEMSRIIFNDRLDAVLCALFIFVVVSVLFASVRSIMRARGTANVTTHEAPHEPLAVGAGE